MIKNKKAIILAAITSIVVAGATYVVLHDDINEVLRYTEYENLKDEGIAKYDILKVESNKLIDLKDEKDVNDLKKYLLKHGMSEEDINNVYKNIEDGKLRVIKTNIKNTSKDDIFVCVGVSGIEQQISEKFNDLEQNNYNEKNGVYGEHALRRRVLNGNSMEVQYHFEYNEDGKFKIDINEKDAMYYGYFSRDNYNVSISQGDEYCSKYNLKGQVYNKIEDCPAKVTIEKNGIKRKNGYEYSLIVYNSSNLKLDNIMIILNIVDEQGERVNMPLEFMERFYLENVYESSGQEIIFTLPENQKVESFVVCIEDDNGYETKLYM